MCVCVWSCDCQVIKRIPLEGMRVETVNDPDMKHGFQIISTCKSFRLEARYIRIYKHNTLFMDVYTLHLWMGLLVNSPV